ncbi:MAG TPA: 3-oxoacyl-[acyl-carrier-protein] reductase [Dehalococcoidia bacterium]|nr:3-oxoacyl-[acyl-carrier-protein] reductase [Dehalococcoidia bacterium]
MDLSDRVAIVTGSGRGIGRAIALRLAEAGANVVVNDVGDMAPAGEVVEEIRRLGQDSLVVPADVSQPDDVASLVDTTVEKYGKVDILVNNAGITRDQLIMRMSDDDWDKVLEINLKSVFLCSRAVLRHMMRQRWGRIVNISSIVGLIGNPGQANYSSSKAGIIGLTRTIAKEVASRGITANAIAPGFIDTPMTQQLPEERRQAIMEQVPLGFLGTPRDVAEAVAFLASEEARYITGQVLTIDGGISLGKL